MNRPKISALASSHEVFSVPSRHPHFVGVNGLLNTQPVRYFVESNIPEECVEVKVFLLFGCYDKLSDRHKDFIKLCFHGVSQLQTTGTFQCVYSFVVRQIDGDRLTSGVAVACIIHGIVYVQVGRCTGTNVLYSGAQGNSFWRAGSMATNFARSLLLASSFNRINDSYEALVSWNLSS